MNKLRRLNKKIIISTVALILAATAFIASVCYAWFVIGLNTKTGNTYTQVVGSGMAFGSTITAVKYYTAVNTDEQTSGTTEGGTTGLETNGKSTKKYNYYVSAGQIIPATKDDESQDNNPFFGSLSLDDYVDITFSVYATDSALKNKEFEIFLTDFGVDEKKFEKNADRTYSFRLAQINNGETEYLETVYGALGVFKWGLVDITKDDDGNEISRTANNMQYFHSGYENTFDYYEYGATDKDFKLTIAGGKFSGNGVGPDYATSFTIRIAVDTADFETLLNNKNAYEYDTQAEEYYLKNITLSIGRIVLSEKE